MFNMQPAMNTVGYFEIHSANPTREITFYTQVFGWTFVNEPALPIEYYRIEQAGINGALLARPSLSPPAGYGANAFVLSVQVSSYDVASARILECGGRVALPKMAIPGKCWQGYFLDLDNNLFGIFQVDLFAA